MTTDLKITSRQQATDNNEMFFFTGKPCRKGHVSKRYTCNGNCFECRNEYMEAKKGTGYFTKRSKEWRDQHPDYYANYRKDPQNLARIYATVQRSRYKDQLGPNYNFDAVVALHLKARELTKSTGIRHGLVHRVPLKDGGLHEASNLAVMTISACHKHTANLRKNKNKA